jgi:hypothetical protein
MAKPHPRLLLGDERRRRRRRRRRKTERERERERGTLARISRS